MVRKTLMFCGVALASLVLSGVASAQEHATIVMRNGERRGGELVDLGGVGFTLRVGGQDQQIPVNDVAAVEFQPGVASGAVQGPIPMPARGVLQLGVNDDHYEDNTGNFTVAVQKIN